ncbi:MAG: uncharacterized protein QOE35_466 [Actinomycetota bacterium]|jgi:uncharacterized protein YceH (UPF0502 family)
MTPVQQRVVGCLVEKELTTPDQYPLSMNALIAACNQSTNRDPVVQLDERVVSNALENLKAESLVRVVFSKGNRVDKYRHVLPEALELDRASLAVITVLLLRGPQTAAELRARTERMHAFAATHAVEHVLAQLAGRDDPLVTLLPRQPGRKEPRWAHLLGAVAATAPAPVPESEDSSAVSAPYVAAAPEDGRITALEERVRVLEERLDQLDG